MLGRSECPWIRIGLITMDALGCQRLPIWRILSWTCGAESPRELDLHRWLGTAAGLWTVGTALFYERDARRHRQSRLSRIAVVTAAILVSAAGHFGGTLVHGEGFFDW